MAIELVLEGKLEKESEKEEFSAFLKELCKQKQLKIEDYDTLVLIDVCPEGRIECSYEDVFVSLSAQSDVAGPGFHAYVCDFFQEVMAKSGITFEVEDPTQYFEKRDFEGLKYNYFYQWLSSMQDYVNEHKQEDLSLCWKQDNYQPFAKKGMVITPLGYISIEDFIHLEVEDLANRFFIWNRLDRDAAYYRNCAYALLWKDCYYEYSAMNEESEKAANMIVDYMEASYEKDDKIALPLDLYEMLCQTIGRETLQLHGENVDLNEIGYRRDLVRYPFGNWSIPVNGYSEVSYDAKSKTLHFMAPYKVSDEPWRWLMNVTTYEVDPQQNVLQQTNFHEDTALDVFDIHTKECKGKGVVHDLDEFIQIATQFQCGKDLLSIDVLMNGKEDIEEFKEVLQHVLHHETEEEIDLKN